jgi:molybdenum cofactor cytidylyltransferase
MKDEASLKLGIIILAAGSSSRMGKSKQLLDVDGEPLLRRMVRVALGVEPDEMIVVLGSNHEEHQKVIEDLPIKTVYNSNWKKGMGSSIKTGVGHLLHQFPSVNAAMILVCDQPLLTTFHLKKLKHAFISSVTPVVAMAYSNTVGVPSIFAKSLFDDLINLPDDKGAKLVIEKSSSLLTIPFPEGSMDLDTPEDFVKFKTQGYTSE